MKIMVSLTGGEVVVSGLEKLASSDRRDLMEKLALVQVRNIRTGVERGEDVNGQRFLPSLRVKLAGGITLMDQNHMLDAVHEMDISGGSATIALGSDLENKKGRIHQDGGTIKGRPMLRFALADGSFRSKTQVTMPARPWFGVRSGDIGRLQAAADAWLSQKVKEVGL
jgi:hypothetical protein